MHPTLPAADQGASFGALGVPEELVRVLTEAGITTPTPIQTATLPDSLGGRDVLGRGRTGSGKTLAFGIPLVARLAAENRRPAPGRPRALILAPTRELVTQIETAIAPLAATARLTTRTIFGGVGQNPQVNALRKGVDILIACPGRLEDLMGQGHANLSEAGIVILDEADHMADLGFLPGVKRILTATPRNGQKLLFSATLDGGIKVIADKFLHDPVTHEADSAESPVSTMTHHVLEVAKDDRVGVLRDLAAAPGRTVVFTRTKHGAKKLAKQLTAMGVPSVDLHGNLSQNARQRNLAAFSEGTAKTLVATDIAARGIHVDDVALVVHADPPSEHKAYLHRSGRTARAGAEGTVITLAMPDQRGEVRSLMRAAKIRPESQSTAVAGSPILTELAPGERVFAEPSNEPVVPAPQQQPSRGGQGGGGGRSRSRRGGGQGGSGRGGQGAGGGRSSGQGGDSRQGGPRQGGRSRGAGQGGAGRGSQDGSGRSNQGGSGRSNQGGSGRSSRPSRAPRITTRGSQG
ncbi:Superfamily II DNA and RNA helicase [Kytococcus aerolatus]|uniref:Superfamily II DNA and RNA helicase n=1 Tax=Kytococcus aerolatus TaxID=592308 RepID=A0A212TGE8_9MICO|nr:DEAD/DEAH box helicase [Kytococcus aerolatus]SNC65102.1 Superfamily II DNA and RNA helicase [Kytococcus aerolatus]